MKGLLIPLFSGRFALHDDETSSPRGGWRDWRQEKLLFGGFVS